MSGWKGVARPPAGCDEGYNERGHLDYGLGQAKHPEGAHDQWPIDEVPRFGWSLHNARARRFVAEGQRRKKVCADIEAQNLQHPERERESATGQCPHDEGSQLGDVVGEVVREEAVNVGVRRSALLDRRDYRGEVVVKQY